MHDRESERANDLGAGSVETRFLCRSSNAFDQCADKRLARWPHDLENVFNGRSDLATLEVQCASFIQIVKEPGW